jgi:hypothetical protein
LSHLTVSSVVIKDIEALRVAAKSLGGELEQSKVFTSYTGDKNPCEYRIKLSGVNYQVGIIRDPKTGAFALTHDNYGYQGSRHDGHLLEEKFGPGLQKLAQAYTRQTAVMAARKAGYMVSEKRLPTGQIKLQFIRA